MSIFKDTFVQSIQDQLNIRQKAMQKRESKDILYLSNRNAWMRLTSSVNTTNKSGDITNDLAKQYILQGGNLDENGKLKQGIGNKNESYSTTSPSGTPYLRGIRPMPGITSVNITSQGAYGSLRQITIKFNAWDIKQLEDLELLYMRPGYSVLLEWGWSPYLNNTGNLENLFQPYDILSVDNTKGIQKSKETIFSDLFTKSTLKHNGNYDAAYGFISNYSWIARADGGYDCQISVVTIGEIIQSLKVNFSSFYNQNLKFQGIIASKITGINVSAMEQLEESYSKNILAGIFYELYQIAYQKVKKSNEGISISGVKDNDGFEYDLFRKTINIDGTTIDPGNSIGEDKEQTYISLESLVHIFNKYVILKDQQSNQPIVSLSTKERTYDKINKNINPLLSLSHPLQISVDPTVCLIKSPFWLNERYETPIIETVQKNGNNIVKFSNDNFREKGGLIEKLINAAYKDKSKDELTNLMLPLKGQDNRLSQLSLQVQQTSVRLNNLVISPTLYNLLNTQLSPSEIKNLTGIKYFVIGSNILDNPIQEYQIRLTELKRQEKENRKRSADSLAFLKNLKHSYFLNNNISDNSVGVIENIYINLQFLYNLATNTNLASQDSKGKDEINLYDFLKNVLDNISKSIGNINNFDIHVDPIDSIARIIDVNYVDQEKQSNIFTKAFELQMHNLKSTVRKYKLESQIFSEQSSIVAIGAQVGNGALGTNSNTLVEFNRGLIDRIIPKRQDPNVQDINDHSEDIRAKLKNLEDNLGVLYTLFSNLKYDFSITSNFPINEANKYKGSLHDIINFYLSISNSSTKNRAIIPTKLSIEMDGIGGLVIGHVFKIPQDLLPKGYKGGDLGAQLGYIITSISHNIAGGDWVTNIDAQTIILDDPKTGIYIDFGKISLPNNKIQQVILPDFSTGDFMVSNTIKTVLQPALVKANVSKGLKYLIEAQARKEGFEPGFRAFRNNNPGNLVDSTLERTKFGAILEPANSKGERRFAKFPSLETGIEAQADYIKRIIAGDHKAYPKDPTLEKYISIYAPAIENNTGKYISDIIDFFKQNNEFITKDTHLSEIEKIS